MTATPEPPDDYDGPHEPADGYCGPVGSCDCCDANIYDDDHDGLCEQCAWRANLSEEDDDDHA